MDIFSQVKEFVIGRRGKETTNLGKMIRGGNSHEHALRFFSQNSIEVNAHRKVSGTADTTRRNADDGQAGNRIAAGKTGLAIG